MKWLGLDIGGAHVKVADGKGFAGSYPFAMWKQPQALTQELRTMIAQAPPCDHLAITMTGELADCFESKGAGVKFILEAVKGASDSRHTRVYLNNGMLVTPQVAASRPLQVAAANWHALARFCGRFARKESALLMDVGSTTTDIVPIVKGEPAVEGTTDTERLIHGELVYCGVERTPLCALVESVPYRGQKCPIAREVFATTRDVYLLTGDLPEEPTSRQTADGRPATKAASRSRIGRMICVDEDLFNHKDAVTMAKAVAEAQATVLFRAVERVVQRLGTAPGIVILSGHGDFLIRRVLERFNWKVRLVSLSHEIGVGPSRCGPAHALAVLAREAAGA
jgi:(4-(4-[2-(gamma-L-glutamylamino)ethyl]phenoxymethyl)furan-2-yl)methanamine synthase